MSGWRGTRLPYNRPQEAAKPYGAVQVIQADDSAVCLQLRFAAEEPGQLASPSSDEKGEPFSPSAMYPWLTGQPGAQKGEGRPHLCFVSM